MATSEARVAANRRNAAKSTGPKTVEGKALKHGMTGGGEVVPASDVAEVDALEVELAGEFRSRGPGQGTEIVELQKKKNSRM